MFKIPTNIKAEPKIILGMFMIDLLIIVSTVMLCLLFTKNLPLAPVMRIALLILSLLFGIFLVIKPTSNPEKRMLQVLMIYTKQDKGVYQSLDVLAVKEYQESKKNHQVLNNRKEW